MGIVSTCVGVTEEKVIVEWGDLASRHVTALIGR